MAVRLIRSVNIGPGAALAANFLYVAQNLTICLAACQL